MISMVKKGDRFYEATMSGKPTKLGVDMVAMERLRILKAFTRAKSYDEALNLMMSYYMATHAAAFKAWMGNPNMEQFEGRKHD
jgi:hypothetical protein